MRLDSLLKGGCSSGYLNIVKYGLHVCCREDECEDAIKQEYLTDTDTLYVHPGQGGYHGAVFELPPEAGGGGVQLQQGEDQPAHSVSFKPISLNYH